MRTSGKTIDQAQDALLGGRREDAKERRGGKPGGVEQVCERAPLRVAARGEERPGCRAAAPPRPRRARRRSSTARSTPSRRVRSTAEARERRPLPRGVEFLARILAGQRLQQRQRLLVGETGDQSADALVGIGPLVEALERRRNLRAMDAEHGLDHIVGGVGGDRVDAGHADLHVQAEGQPLARQLEQPHANAFLGAFAPDDEHVAAADVEPERSRQRGVDLEADVAREAAVAELADEVDVVAERRADGDRHGSLDLADEPRARRQRRPADSMRVPRQADARQGVGQHGPRTVGLLKAMQHGERPRRRRADADRHRSDRAERMRAAHHRARRVRRREQQKTIRRGCGDREIETGRVAEIQRLQRAAGIGEHTGRCRDRRRDLRGDRRSAGVEVQRLAGFRRQPDAPERQRAARTLGERGVGGVGARDAGVGRGGELQVERQL